MIVPSHFIPLAAPGMVALGLRWMWNPESPFYVRPRWSAELFSWGWKFWQAATRAHVERAAPLLRDLSFASRACFEELASAWGDDFGLVQRGLLMLCKTAHALEEEARTAAQARDLGVPAEVLDAAAARHAGAGGANGRRRRGVFSRKIATSRPRLSWRACSANWWLPGVTFSFPN